MKTVTLTMTLEQAEAACKGLDLLARISMGQMNIVAELARFGALRARDGERPEGRDLSLDELDRVEQLCEAIKREMGLSRGESFGIGSRAVSTDAHRAYEVLCVLRQAVAHERSPGRQSVWHDGLRLRYTQDPAPSAVVAEEA